MTESAESSKIKIWTSLNLIPLQGSFGAEELKTVKLDAPRLTKEITLGRVEFFIETVDISNTRFISRAHLSIRQENERVIIKNLCANKIQGIVCFPLKYVI